jgi:phage terminase large subunit-like protein
MTDQALDLLRGLVLENGARWGDRAEWFQLDDAAAVLDQEGPRRHFWTRPRGASKTTDAAGCAIAALLAQAPAGARAYAFASDRDQAGLMIDSVAGFVDRTPGLAGALDVQSWRVTAARSGATLEIQASDDASAWGLRPWFVVVSEFAAWRETAGPKRLWRAIFSALPKVAGSRLLVETNAGEPSHFSAGVLDRARKQPDRWRVSETPGPCPWLDPDDLEEQKVELPAWEFERLHLNRWSESEDRLTAADDLAACVVLDGPRDRIPGRTYALGLDVGLTKDRTVLSVCSTERSAPAVALDRMIVWQGSRREPVSLDAVEATCVEAWEAYGKPRMVADRWQAAQLIQRLRRRGVKVEEYAFTQQSVSRLALTLHALIRDHALELPPDEELIDELGNVRLREVSPGTFRLDHDAGRHDDRAIALSLAASFLVEHGSKRSGGGVAGMVIRDATGRLVEPDLEPGEVSDRGRRWLAAGEGPAVDPTEEEREAFERQRIAETGSAWDPRYGG